MLSLDVSHLGARIQSQCGIISHNLWLGISYADNNFGTV